MKYIRLKPVAVKEAEAKLSGIFAPDAVREGLSNAGCFFVGPNDDGAESVDLILSRRDRTKFGVIVNRAAYPCRMEGCTGMRMHVRWNNGSRSYPCSKGCECIASGLEKIM